MLNRRQVRLKVMQVLYMHQQSGREASANELHKVFDQQVEKMEKLYLYYLSFIKELDHQSLVYDEDVRNKYVEASRSATEHLRLRENPIVRAIADSKHLEERLEKLDVMFNHEVDDNLVQKVFYDLKNSEYYKDYVELSNQPGQHEELVLHIFKHYSENFQLFEQHFEEEFTNFYDDKKLVVSMLKKTIQNIMAEKENILVEFIQDEENTLGFGYDLITRVTNHNQELHEAVQAKILKWEPGQVAIIDTILIKMGIAEFKYFASIPSTVTINEYVELAKNYSPPNSKKFVNGVLDSVSREIAQSKN
jgi:N utilization substance protein B